MFSDGAVRVARRARPHNRAPVLHRQGAKEFVKAAEDFGNAAMERGKAAEELVKGAMEHRKAAEEFRKAATEHLHARPP